MRRFDPVQLDTATNRLGEVVLDPSQWPSLLEELSIAAGVTGAALMQSDVYIPDVPRTATADDLIQNFFRDGWYVRCVRAGRSVPLMLGGRSVVTDDDILTHDELQTDAEYNELFIPLGFPRFTAVGFMAGSALWALCFQRTLQDAETGGAERKILARLSRQLTEVATLSTAVGRATLSSATNALDKIRKAAVAVNHTGRVLYANTSALAMFDSDLNLRGARLWSTDAEARTQLAALIERMNFSSDLEAFPADPIVVRRGGQQPIMIHVLPVHGAARSPFLGARAILTLTPATPRLFSSQTLLSRAFNLTAAEARLATRLSTGASIEMAANELKIGKETARSQLKAVYAKIGIHRQVELVALLASLIGM